MAGKQQHCYCFHFLARLSYFCNTVLEETKKWLLWQTLRTDPLSVFASVFFSHISHNYELIRFSAALFAGCMLIICNWMMYGMCSSGAVNTLLSLCGNSHVSLCQKMLGEDHPFFGPKCFFRFKFSLNKPNFIWKSMHQWDNKDKLDSQSQFWVSKIWKFTPSPGRKLAKEGWTFWVHRFSCRFVCIFLL